MKSVAIIIFRVKKHPTYRLPLCNLESSASDSDMEAELQAQIPGLDRVISEYSVVSLRRSYPNTFS